MLKLTACIFGLLQVWRWVSVNLVTMFFWYLFFCTCLFTFSTIMSSYLMYIPDLIVELFWS